MSGRTMSGSIPPVPEADESDGLLARRGRVYGGYPENASRVAAAVAALDLDSVRERDEVVWLSMMMIVVKLSRLVVTPGHLDSWMDIIGYAQLVVDDLEVRQ